ncbi:MAG: 5'/3'-nucleotidase SurE [Gammaproteobacteria bacterium]
MHILISNDDGIFATGINVLATTLREIAEVDMIAPDRNRSGASNSLTLDAPLYIRRLDNGAIVVAGTPTDCVHLALTGLLEKDPDMVISGINEGANLGDDILYSGTVAAAIEGRFLGKPAIAISLAGENCQNYETAAAVARLLVQQLITDPLPATTILNVNVPDVSFAELKGFEITRLGTRHRAAPTIKQQDPRGRTVYWIGPAGKEQDAGPGTDFYAVSNRKVSISPLQIDWTHYKTFDQVAKWAETFNQHLI